MISALDTDLNIKDVIKFNFDNIIKVLVKNFHFIWTIIVIILEFILNFLNYQLPRSIYNK